MSIGDSQIESGAEPAQGSAEKDLGECTACSTKLPHIDLVDLKCEDEYCRGCLEKLFESAMKDETMYPPRCCGVTITTKHVRPYLARSLLRKFELKQPELRTRNRTYCHRPHCSAFIAPHSIHNGQAICQKCRAVTCSKCRNKWHYGACAEGEDAELFHLIRTTRWKRCPSCRRVVEKNRGCNHVICRCGTEFCYGCGKKCEQCVCTGSQDEGDENEHSDYED